jgi:hypothetical protein
MRAVYTVTIFVSAALLFLIQPMFARMILPFLGGSPAVWNTAMVFYQTMLLAGYAYAHLTISRLGARRQAAVHVAVMLLPLLALPIAVPAGWAPPTTSSPVPWLLALLVVAVGLPYFVVSASSPLLQAWFAAGGSKAGNPYALYAASNLGSMLGLLGYPALVEPRLRLAEQSLLWSGGYLLLLALTAGCAAMLWRAPRDEAATGSPALAPEPAPTWRRRLRWILLAMAPSSLLLSVTSYISADIAAIPLLWVWPLAIYLLTFTLVFADRPLLPHWIMVRALPIVLLPLLITILAGATQPLELLIPLHLITFFVAAMVCHGELAADRPGPARLTEFYLLLSLGGALGGMANALLAPQIFNSVLEYPLTLALCGFLLPAGLVVARARNGEAGSAPEQAAGPATSAASSAGGASPAALGISAAALKRRPSAFSLDLLLPAGLGLLTVALIMAGQALSLRGPAGIAVMLGLPALICFSFSRRPLRFGLGLAALLAASVLYTRGNEQVLYAERTFFGVHRVFLDGGSQTHVLAHGNTKHGAQSLEPERRQEPLTYYTRSGPIGQIFAERGGQPGLRVGAVGLGVATVACYAQPGQSWTFYEIDPAVARIARDPALFTFLRDCLPDAPIVLGDARLSLAAGEGQYDLLILDAYSSDAIPIHLITREALALYLDRLAPDGVLAFHISNQHLDLEPVLADLAADAGLTALVRNDQVLTQEEWAAGKAPSVWVLLARPSTDLGPLATDPRWQPARRVPGARLWTDDFSSLLSVLR